MTTVDEWLAGLPATDEDIQRMIDAHPELLELAAGVVQGPPPPGWAAEIAKVLASTPSDYAPDEEQPWDILLARTIGRAREAP